MLSLFNCNISIKSKTVKNNPPSFSICYYFSIIAQARSIKLRLSQLTLDIFYGAKCYQSLTPIQIDINFYSEKVALNKKI